MLDEPFSSLPETIRRLRSCFDAFLIAEDNRAAFLGVYLRTTLTVAREIRAGGFENPGWVREYLVTFANLYREAVLADERDEGAELSSAWARAFASAERTDTLPVTNAALGVNAHINYDLAQALAAVGVDEDRDSRYRDHARVTELIGDILAGAWAWLTGEDGSETDWPTGGGPSGQQDGLDPIGERLGVATVAVCRERAWQRAVALETGSRLEAAVAQVSNARLASGVARLITLATPATHQTSEPNHNLDPETERENSETVAAAKRPELPRLREQWRARRRSSVRARCTRRAGAV